MLNPISKCIPRLSGHPAGFWRGGLLALAAGLIWVAHHDRWTLANWCLPTDYYGDALEILARVKAAAEGDLWPLRPQTISRLGAPFSAHWDAYPAPDKLLILVLGGLSHVLGLYATVNVALTAAQITAALAFYLVARWLRAFPEWAAAGALLFAYTYHTFHRGLAHFSLVFTWTVPAGLAVVWMIAASRRLAWSRPGAWVSLLTAVALGSSNPYNLFFWLQLMGWALLWQCLGSRRQQNLQIGAAAVAASLLALAISHGESWLYVDNPDALPLLARNYGGTELYALKPVEMFIPPAYHRWEWLAFFGHRYARWTSWRGEAYLPYLGLAGIAGLVWLGVATIRRLLIRRPLPGQALTIGWILAYATVGGVTNLVALFAGVHLFRATNRAAIFISAIALVFLVGRLSRLTARWTTWGRWAAAGLLAGVGVFEQIPRPHHASREAHLAADVAMDREFGVALERMLPTRAMVFQLPVVGFPEVNGQHQLGAYEHFRPYLSTHHLSFSFGAPKSRSRSRWQRELENQPVAEIVAQLERHGFSALYINRKGYADHGERTLRELTALGYTDRLDARGGHQVVVRLRPAPHPEPPLARAPTFGQGWHARPDAGWRWAYQDAFLSYYNPYPHPIRGSLRINLIGITSREVLVEQEGRQQWRGRTTPEPGQPILLELELKPGVNRFKLRSEQPAVRRGSGRDQLRSFAIDEPSARMTVHPPLPLKSASAAPSPSARMAWPSGQFCGLLNSNGQTRESVSPGAAESRVRRGDRPRGGAASSQTGEFSHAVRWQQPLLLAPRPPASLHLDCLAR